MAIIVNVVSGTPTTGLWCAACLKPSGYAVELNVLSTRGVTSIGVIRKCFDCGAPLPPDEEPRPA